MKWNKQGDDRKDRQTGMRVNWACDEHLHYRVSWFDEEGHLAISALFFLTLCIYPLIYNCMKKKKEKKKVYMCVLS